MTQHLSLALVLALAGLIAPPAAHSASRGGDSIAVVVNQELVTAGEVEQRLARVRENAARNHSPLPPDAELRKQVLDSLIDERVLLSYARDSGVRVEDPELDRAMQSIAAQNQLTVPQLRERLRHDGMDYITFRNNLRDQMLVERVREQEVQSRIRVTDGEIDEFVSKQRGASAQESEYDIQQILVAVPEGATITTVAERRARAETALKRVLGGEDFGTVARQLSDDGNRERGGAIGMRAASRLPDIFVEVVSKLKDGEISPTLLRSGAGFHVLKLVSHQESAAFRVIQTHARHILIRPTEQAAAEAVVRRMAEYRRQIERGERKFEDVARQVSEDGSANNGGDLGWTTAGSFVPEFEEAMNRLQPGGLSEPVVSRFGVHLIQVLERRDVALDLKQVREQARNSLREQKFAEAYEEWLRDLRSKAYIERRDAQ